MRLRTLGAVDRHVDSICNFVDPQYGPLHKHINHVADDLKAELKRGDFTDPWTKLVVKLWLWRESRRRAARDSQTPHGLALRSTAAAERANRYSLAALIISLLALAVSIWPEKAAEVITLLPKKGEAVPRR